MRRYPVVLSLAALAAVTALATGPAPATPPPPTALAAPAGPVSLEVLPRFQQLHVGADGAALDLLVRLKATGEAPKERPGLDLVVVIDRSGSMRGDKLTSVKAATLRLLDQLAPTDRVTLLSYSNAVSVDAAGSPAGPSGKALRDAVMRIQAGGGTALGPALFEALDHLARQDNGESRLAHVMLMSDGLANAGEQRPEILGGRAAAAFREGVTVSTLGVGVDYNEDLMTRLADQGGGRYHFIQDSQAVARVLNDELGGLVATVARGVELSLTGAEVIKVFGYPTTSEDGAVRARIGSLGAGQVREVVIRVKVPAGPAGAVNLGQLALSLKDATRDGAPASSQAKLAVSRTADAKAAAASEDVEVAVRVTEVEAAERLEQVAIATSRGDFAAAQGQLQVAVDALKEEVKRKPNSAKLKAQLYDFEGAQVEMEAARSSGEGQKGYTKKLKARAYDTKKR